VNPLHYGFITEFSRELPLNSYCCTMDSSHDSHVNSSWMAHVVLRNHHSILSLAPPELLIMDYELPQNYHVNSWLNDSCWTTESSQQFHVSSNWMPRVALLNRNSILTWTPPEWMAYVELLNHHIILSWTPHAWLILKDEIAIAFPRELFPSSPWWTMESSEHFLVTSPRIAHIGFRNHHSIIT
jgi:hypothetical protein